MLRPRMSMAVLAVLVMAGSAHATPWAINIINSAGTSSYKGNALVAGQTVTAYTPDGVLLGTDVIETAPFPADLPAPYFSTLTLAGNDPDTSPGADEGGEVGETPVFRIDGDLVTEIIVREPGAPYNVIPGGVVTWELAGPTYNVDLVVPDLTLQFLTQPAASVSGQALGTQPVVRAWKSGALDAAFTEDVTLSLALGAAGTLSGTLTVQAVAGVATFANVTYTALVDGESFTIQANDQDGAGTDDYPLNSANAINSDVVATQLLYATQPAPLAGVSGVALDFTTDPMVEARDGDGTLDTDFTDTVTLTAIPPADSYTNNSVAAVAGQATFTNLTVTYTVTVDGETYGLQADDTGGGAEGDITALPTSSNITVDILATQLVFTTQPASSVSGFALGTQPVVTARDGDGKTDTDFGEVVTLDLPLGGGTLANATATAASGVATFAGLAYTAASDGEAFTLRADDVAGGTEGDLATTNASSINSDVIATAIVFSTQPSGSVSGAALTIQPVVTAQDADGTTDTDFTEDIALTLATGGGTLGGTATVAAAGGMATFAGLDYTATVDGESFTLQANDQDGVGTDLPTVNASGVASDVVVTALVFSTQPADAYNTVDLLTQPVVTAVDGDGTTDTDFTETVTLTATAVLVQGGAGTGLEPAGTAVAAVAGVATFVTIQYNVGTDADTFFLTANDEDGVGANTPTVNSATIQGLILPPPVLTPVPAEVIFYQENQTPLLQWSTVLVAASYEIDLGTAGGGCNDIESATPVAGTSFQSSRLADGAYCWRVRSIGALGNASPWSGYENFNTIPTFGEWGLIFLIASMIGYAGWHLRRRSTVAA